MYDFFVHLLPLRCIVRDVILLYSRVPDLVLSGTVQILENGHLITNRYVSKKISRHTTLENRKIDICLRIFQPTEILRINSILNHVENE